MNKKQLEELRSFIVGSNLEYSFLSQLDDYNENKYFTEWLGLNNRVRLK